MKRVWAMEYMAMVINILFTILVIGGVIMTMVGLPGNILIVLIGLAYGYYDGFEHVDYTVLVIIVGVFILSELIESWAGLIGAKKEKASKRAIAAAFVGTMLGGIWGTAILPLIGSILGALFGAFIITALAEYTKTKNKEQAIRVAIGVLKGQIVGMIVKLTAAIGMAVALIYQLKWQ
ncbi:MAG: hypothetical protein H6Q68_1821 [Firmicutes bacterium]|nr:hypothetical protein [Bacillota bacterium]